MTLKFKIHVSIDHALDRRRSETECTSEHVKKGSQDEAVCGKTISIFMTI